MTLPGVYIEELDGQLGVQSAAASGKAFVVVGPADDGPTNLPSSFSRVKDLVATFKGGQAVEALAYYIERYQRPGIIVRTATSTEPAVTAVDSDDDNEGTSIVTIADDPTPNDDYQLALEFLKPGTVGQAGITYRLSYDAGRTWSPAMALGTADTITVPGAGGIVFELAAGTVAAGDLHEVDTTAASWGPTELQAALEPLGVTAVQWEIVLVVGSAIDATNIDTIEAVRSMPNGKHIWYGNTRVPNDGESEAAYAAAMATLSAAKSSKDASLATAACLLTSAISGRVYRRPASWPAAARQASVMPHINIADVDLGPLPGVSIRDANGMPIEHDESVFPGLDDMRYVTLTTHPRRQGVYVTLPRTFAPTGSDYEILPHRRVINLAREVLYDYLLGILHKPILVSRKTGLILPSVATAIELGGDAALAAVLFAEPMASGAYIKVSRTDNLLSVPRLNGDGKVLPLAYPRWINFGLGFENPAMQIEAV
jgi:hypothetical protein